MEKVSYNVIVESKTVFNVFATNKDEAARKVLDNFITGREGDGVFNEIIHDACENPRVLAVH